MFVIPAPIYARDIQCVMFACYKTRRKVITTLNASHLLYWIYPSYSSETLSKPIHLSQLWTSLKVRFR